MTRKHRRAEQIRGLLLLCRRFFALSISEEEAAMVLSTKVSSSTELPEIVRRLRVLH